MTERNNVITFKGKPMTLTGNPVQKGDKAPNFKVVGNDLSEVTLDQYKGKTVVLSVVPSLDTGVCDAMGKRFNDEAIKLGSDVNVLIISEDLPFAQKRWCGASNATAVKTVSDYKDRDFGKNYGLYIKELGLLTRAVLVIGPDGKIKYSEIVPEVTNHPNYDAAIAAVKN
jgi:thiol peroxidase